MPTQNILLKRGSKADLDVTVLKNGEAAWAKAATGHHFLAVGDGVTQGGRTVIEVDSNGDIVNLDAYYLKTEVDTLTDLDPAGGLERNVNGLAVSEIDGGAV